MTRQQLFVAAIALCSVAAPAFAGRVGGPGEASGAIPSGGSRTFYSGFRAAEPAVVSARGDGDIDMFVYDENGNEIAKDTLYDPNPVCRWTPRWTGEFRIVIRNAARYTVDFRLETN